MAECRICGYIDEKLPDRANWQCDQCEYDEMNGSVGCHSNEERRVCLNGYHASAPHRPALVAEIDQKPSKQKALSHIQRLRTGSQVRTVILDETKRCPVCDARQYSYQYWKWDKTLKKHILTTKERIDIGKDGKRIFGARCEECEYTYGREGFRPGLSDRSSESMQGDSGNESPGEGQSGVYD